MNTRRARSVAGLLAVLATAALVPAADAGAAANDPYSQAIVAAGPVSYWRLADSGSVATDEIGTNNGTLSGGVTTGVPGAIGGSTDTAMRFDGTNDFVALGSSPTLQPQSFTLETWFRSPGQPSAPGYLARWRTFGWSAILSQRGTVTGGVYGASGTQYLAESSASYDDGAWHHLVVSKGAASLVLIVDGVQVASVVVPEAVRYEPGAAAIGRDGNANNWYFNGDIDEFAFYARPLTLAEADAHYCLGGGTGALCNHAPTASAGADQTVTEGTTVSLSGAASSDPDGNTLTQSWQLLSSTGAAITLANPTSSHPSFAATDDGTYTFRLTVNDGFASATDDTVVTVTNAVPTVVAIAGPGATSAGAQITATFDDAGLVDSHTARFDWGDGTAVESVNAPGAGHGTVVRSHTYGATGDYQVSVTITDDDGGTAGRTVAVSATVPTGGGGTGSGGGGGTGGGGVPTGRMPAAALWATSKAGYDALALNGDTIKVTGLAHSNASAHVFGNSVRLLGGTEYAGRLRLGGRSIVVDPAAVRTPPVVGTWLGIADYRPGSPRALTAGAKYFDMTSQCRRGIWHPTTPLPAGLYYARCSVSLLGSTLPNPVSIAAEGNIDLWLRRGAKLTPFVDGLQLVSGSGGRGAITVIGDHAEVGGSLVARIGGIRVWGDSVAFRCGLLADDIGVAGDGHRFAACS